ncbi:Trypsin-like peptidase domain-containing protein [Chitinophaga sp. CF118]|uniref:S8 family serine peptidase n=1 Tax=Chitinophaga sp. CF118 TaxID=1884367 RepID=UPI0008E908EF|nr:S8 family serine peptidase [Chitinophaga sp. CF118]SFD98110.1 Trypsin-like peptidase domain-containing protein [Chitinophaga sp. CF118]
MNIDVKRHIADRAYSRYISSLQEIENVRNGILHNRQGNKKVTEINNSPDRLAKRILREGLPPDEALERINGVPNFQDVAILRKLFGMSTSICRIMISFDFGGTGYGTGFLIASDLIITNHHVLPDTATANTAQAQFGYELDEKGNALNPVSFRLRPDRFFLTSDIIKDQNVPFSGLDFSIVAIETTSTDNQPLNQFGYIQLDGGTGKMLEGENCVVIQHPQGDYKKVVLKDIRMLTLVDDFMIYESDTSPGSSGSAVIALGTGTIVSLHHSAVPRKNAQNQWLRKDGTVASDGDNDDVIDWLGNEGIRISSIVKAIQGMEVPVSMQACKEQLLKAQVNMFSPQSTQMQQPSTQAILQAAGLQSTIVASAPAPTSEKTPLVYFEVELTTQENLQENWISQVWVQVPGLQSVEQLFPMATASTRRQLYYIGVRSSQSPWELAAQIETLPHVNACTPDLPVQTYINSGLQDKPATATESQIFNTGRAVWNEKEFTDKWAESSFCKDFIAQGNKLAYRQWNKSAIKLPSLSNATRTNLSNLKLVQLDTGYSDHSKVRNGYNFNEDADFIDDDNDARDRMSTGPLLFPSHGTRTASLVIGGKITGSTFANDGNSGVLSLDDSPLIKLVPYRISKSVALIGRGKDMVNAATHAINNNADVMYMCMGSYPRPMIEEIARLAYEKGVIWVCAAGNEVELVIAPAMYPGTIAVAGINPDGKPWKDSCRGPSVDISAPGEDVYVPFLDKDDNDIMVFGSGTSYAAPQVAAAAMLWKAKRKEELRNKYTMGWQIVEAFRRCLQKSAFKPGKDWETDKYGAGILDITALLNVELPDLKPEDNAYFGQPPRPFWDLGIREAVHHIWNTLIAKLTPDTEAALSVAPLTQRGRLALEAFSSTQAGPFEAATNKTRATRKILDTYFESYIAKS